MNHLADRVIAITGAGGGFGRLVACNAAAQGAAVVAADIDAQAAAETAAMIEEAGGRVCAVGAVVKVAAGGGIMGTNVDAFAERFTAILEGAGEARWTDPDSVEFFALEPEQLAEQIIYAINQPWGVSISDLTVRASGDMYMI